METRLTSVERQYSRVEEEDLRFLREVVGPENVSTKGWELAVSSANAVSEIEGRAEAVVWPSSAEQVSRILAHCSERRIPVTPRGSGSSTSGNAAPVEGGIVISTRRMNRVLEVSREDLLAVVEPGVIYEELNVELRRLGLFFPPEPASGSVSTIGGMVGNNSSGFRAVKYGVTRDYVAGLEVVLPSGEVVRLGTRAPKSSIGYDLVRLFVGSEGTLGFFTKITLKLRPLPEARRTGICYAESAERASSAIFDVVASPARPSAVEYMDSRVLRLLVESGYPYREAGAALLLETDGTERAAEDEMSRLESICRSHGNDFRRVEGGEEEALWKGRRSLGALVAKLSPAVIVGDVDVPVSKLPWMVEEIYRLGDEMKVGLVVFGHAGDGNLHVNILAGGTDESSRGKAWELYARIMERTIEAGGAIAGEHGIGVEKRQFMEAQHGRPALDLMRKLKEAVDPSWIMNPGKILPDPS
ncbi:MAG: FAD-binding oxidoreductase [Conexivisphaera sp.]